MKRSVDNLYWNLCMSVFVLAFLSVLTSSPAFAQGPPGGLGVKVLNTPLPVQGTVSVGGAVSITGTPNVNVTNPASAPAITSSVDDPGRIPYQAAIRVDNNCNSANDNCQGAFPAVPTGHRLVVQRISVFARDSGANYVRAFMANSEAFMMASFFVPVSPPAPSTGQVAVVDQAVQFYIDGGHSFSASISTDGDFGPAAQVAVTVTGYLLNCSVNPCTAIAP